jgi:hypothetical protein
LPASLPRFTHTSASAFPNPCTIAPSRLAIFQGAPHHTEVFGFLLDYCRACAHNCTVFHGPGERLSVPGMVSPTSALPLYRQLYAPLDVRPLDRFALDDAEFAAVFFTTPDDRFVGDWRLLGASRFVYCVHLTVPGFVRRWQLLRLYMTPLAGVPYTLPVFSAVTPLPASARRRTVVMVGAMFQGENVVMGEVAEVASALDKNGYTLTIFTTNVEDSGPEMEAFRESGGTKVEFRLSRPTDELHAAVASASYVLILPSDNSWYMADRMTGALPLAISYGTPILTKEKFARIYGLSAGASGTVVGDGATGVASSVGKVTAGVYADLVAAAVEFRARLARHNQFTIESVLQYVPGLGGGGEVMPLSEDFRERVVPRLGDP